ncbi:MAG: hypothetical protein NTV22_01145 [bacterium]|nr:hypothetical protein [bacterium]
MIDVDAQNNEPVCVIGKNMEPNTESIKNIRRYYALLKKAEDEFGKIKSQENAMDRHMLKVDMPQEEEQ